MQITNGISPATPPTTNLWDVYCNCVKFHQYRFTR